MQHAFSLLQQAEEAFARAQTAIFPYSGVACAYEAALLCSWKLADFIRHNAGMVVACNVNGLAAWGNGSPAGEAPNQVPKPGR